MTRHSTRVVALAACLVAAQGCRGNVCAPGSTQACLCPGQQAGVQVCDQSGGGWGSCSCGGATAAGAGGAAEAPAPPAGAGAKIASSPGSSAGGAAASESTPETCKIASFTEPKEITTSIYDPPRGEFDFAYNDGLFALIVATESAYGSGIEIKLFDKTGNRVGATYNTKGDRMEYDPCVVAAPWGGFFVGYKFDKHGTGQEIRISGRTLGYDGTWKSEGFLATTNASAYGIRLRNMDGTVGMWWKEYDGSGSEVEKYLEVIDNQKAPKPMPPFSIPPLVDDSWLDRMKATPGWPTSQNKAIRPVWAGDRFGVMMRKKKSGGMASFLYFAALCE